MVWNPAAGPLSDPWLALHLAEIDSPDMKANITDNFNALQAAIFTVGTWTPSWTATGSAPGIGNGTSQGSYTQIGKLLIAQAVVTLGSTSTVGSGTYIFSLPVAMSSSYPLNAPVGEIVLSDVSANAAYPRTVIKVTSTTVAGFAETNAALSASSPVVPANGDSFLISLSYVTS